MTETARIGSVTAPFRPKQRLEGCCASGVVMRTMLKSKIHRATVTDANLHYEGSVTVDPVLMEAADLLPFEQVHLLDIHNGARLETYVIQGERGSREICVNGAAAHLIHRGDTLIIVSYDTLSEDEAKRHEPKLVYVDESNNIVRTGHAIETPALVTA